MLRLRFRAPERGRVAAPGTTGSSSSSLIRRGSKTGKRPGKAVQQAALAVIGRARRRTLCDDAKPR